VAVSYTFRFPADLAGAGVTVTDVKGGTVTAGTLDGAATFTTSLPEGTYTGVAKRGSHSFSTAADGTAADPDDTEFARQIGTPGSATQAALSATFARRRFESINTRAAGAVVFTWDDGYPEWAQMIDLANRLGQRHTLCVTSNRIDAAGGITSATIAAAAAAGHEIAAHSKTHTKINSTLLTAAQRLDEYESPRTALESIIGAGKVRTWVYPFGTASTPAGRDTTTDKEIYLRYDRQLDTLGGCGAILSLNAPPKFTIPRSNFDTNSDTSLEQMKELVRRAASAPIIVPIYSHDFSTPAKWTRVQALMQLAADLGVPALTSAEAFPAFPTTLPDPSFEGSTVTWTVSTDGGAGVIDHATVTPDVNIPGTKALRITTAGQTTKAPIAYADWQCDPSVSISITGRVRSDITASGATPKVYVRADFFKYDGSSAGSGVDSAALNGATWTNFDHTVTPPAGTDFVRVKLVQQQIDGVTYFDHIHLGPTQQGKLG